MVELPFPFTMAISPPPFPPLSKSLFPLTMDGEEKNGFSLNFAAVVGIFSCHVITIEVENGSDNRFLSVGSAVIEVGRSLGGLCTLLHW